LGNAYKHNGQYQEAIKCFEDTLQLHTRKALSTDYIKTLFNLGNTHTKFNKLTEAFNIYKEAIDTLEDDLIDKLKADDDAKRKLGEEWFKIYQYMIAVCLKLGKQNSKYSKYYATAWEYAERSKARRLVELFGQTKPDDVSDEIWKEFQDLRNKITNEQKWIEDQEKLIILSEESLSQYPELDTKKANLTNLKQQLNQKAQ
jgi:Tetratricopeptide repeat.